MILVDSKFNFDEYQYMISTNEGFKCLKRNFRKLEPYFKNAQDFHLKNSKRQELRGQAMQFSIKEGLQSTPGGISQLWHSFSSWHRP